jgi:hypothetical protein
LAQLLTEQPVRIVTDQGISGYGQAESAKPYLKPMVLFYKEYLLGASNRSLRASKP